MDRGSRGLVVACFVSAEGSQSKQLGPRQTIISGRAAPATGTSSELQLISERTHVNLFAFRKVLHDDIVNWQI
jgi:hypothetical protein